jgi:hypothetical protein
MKWPDWPQNVQLNGSNIVVAWALVLELAWFVIDFCGASILRKLCAICSNSVNKSSALTYGDAGWVGGPVDVTLGCKKLFCEVPCRTSFAAPLISKRR